MPKDLKPPHPPRPSILANDIDRVSNAVRHKRLRQVMETAGVPRNLTGGINDCGSNRTRSFHFDGEIETPKTVDTGLSQGSPLFPILFVVYSVTTISPCRSGHQLESIYMDDDTLLKGATSYSSAIGTIHDTANKGIERAISRGMKYGERKSQLIIRLPTTSQFKTTISVIHTVAAEVQAIKTIKLPGITINQKLTFREHRGKATAKTRNAIPHIQQLLFAKGPSMTTHHHMVTTLLTPTQLWGSEIWWTRAQHILDNLNPTYLKFACLITNLPKWTRTDKLLPASILPPLKA